MTERRKGGKNPSDIPGMPRRVLTPEELRLRMIYTFYRRQFEILKSRPGSEATALYRAPSAYDGKPGQYLSSQNPHEVKPYVAGRGSDWQLLMRHCKENNLDPILLIADVFDHLPREAKHTPEPGNLRGDNYILAYQEMLAGLPAKIRVSLEVERSKARSWIAVQSHYLPKAAGRAMTQWDIYDNVLSDMTRLSPLFRYCLATEIAKDGGSRFRQLTYIIRHDAVLQFYPYRAFYLDSWKEVLPGDFVTNAKQWYYDILHSETKEV